MKYTRQQALSLMSRALETEINTETYAPTAFGMAAVGAGVKFNTSGDIISKETIQWLRAIADGLEGKND